MKLDTYVVVYGHKCDCRCILPLADLIALASSPQARRIEQLDPQTFRVTEPDPLWQRLMCPISEPKARLVRSRKGKPYIVPPQLPNETMRALAEHAARTDAIGPHEVHANGTITVLERSENESNARSHRPSLFRHKRHDKVRERRNRPATTKSKRRDRRRR